MNKLFALAAVLALGMASRVLPVEDERAVEGRATLAAPVSPPAPAASDAAMAQWRARPEAPPSGTPVPPRPAAASLDPREMP